jgi:hypothetical protein
MKKAAFVVLLMIMAGLVEPVLGAEMTLGPESVPRITIQELKGLLGSPDVVIIDVRQPHDWNESEVKIKGAVREDPHRFGSWLSKYPSDRTIVLYCK